MTKAQVERILGGPPGNYLSNYDFGVIAYGREPLKYQWYGLVEGGTLDLWYTDHGTVFVNYRDDGTVYLCSLTAPMVSQRHIYFPR